MHDSSPRWPSAPLDPQGATFVSTLHEDGATVGFMHPDIDVFILLHGFVTRPQILACGFHDDDIAELIRLGALDRLGPGLYAPCDPTRTPEQRHVLRCRATATRFGDSVVFTHQSAAALHGLPVWGVDLANLHVTRLDTGRGRVQAHVHHHVGSISTDEIVEIDGMLVATTARAVWDLAVAASTESALVTADAALHGNSVGLDELRELAGRYTSWRGSRHAKSTLSFSDGRSESPAETRFRWTFRVHDIPRPEPQFVVCDEYGQVVGRSDFGWEEYCHLAEVDGVVKYRSTTHEPAEASRTVVREKKREDKMRSPGFGMSRFVVADLEPRVARFRMLELRRTLDVSQRRYARVIV